MIEPRSREQRTKVHLQKDRHGAANATRGAAAAAAGRSTYRQEFQPDYGPDRDESLDGAESGRRS